MDIPPQLPQIQQVIQDMGDYWAEQDRRAREIGYQIDQSSHPTTSQPR